MHLTNNWLSESDDRFGLQEQPFEDCEMEQAFECLLPSGWPSPCSALFGFSRLHTSVGLLLMVHSEHVPSCSFWCIFPFLLCYALLCFVMFYYVLLCFVIICCVLLCFVFVSAYLKVGLLPFFPHFFFFVVVMCCCVVAIHSQASESGLVALKAPHFLERG
jgi:hypothetical protein